MVAVDFYLVLWPNNYCLAEILFRRQSRERPTDGVRIRVSVHLVKVNKTREQKCSGYRRNVNLFSEQLTFQSETDIKNLTRGMGEPESAPGYDKYRITMINSG